MKTLYKRYFDAVLDGFEVIRKQTDLIRSAGTMLAEAKIAGGRWVLYDFGYAMALDTWTRGSNPCDNYLFIFNTKRFASSHLAAKEFQDGDCLVLGSYRADEPEELVIVSELKKKNNTRLITISPHRKPEEPRTDILLHEQADVAIDNGADNGGGNFKVPGVDSGILSYARDINLTISQAIIAEYIQNMVDAGCPPTQFYMVHFPYFREIQDIMWKRIKKYGY